MSRSDRILVASGAGALVLVAAAAWMLLAPVTAERPLDAVDGAGTVTTSAAASPTPSVAVSDIVIDVQGAVTSPGIRELPAGARVADAIAAAGGYASDADLAAAALTVNLAAPLIDGGQVRIPRIGDAVAAAPAASTRPGAAAGQPSGAGSGLVDLNSATPEELEALPGIGPVTVQKIVAARQEQPFESLQDAVDRGILNRGQLEDIQALATAG